MEKGDTFISNIVRPRSKYFPGNINYIIEDKIVNLVQNQQRTNTDVFNEAVYGVESRLEENNEPCRFQTRFQY